MFDIEKIEKARIINGLNKGDLAKKVGIHPYSYTRILKGEIQNPPTIKRICDVLGLSMEEIYIDDSPKEAA